MGLDLPGNSSQETTYDEEDGTFMLNNADQCQYIYAQQQICLQEYVAHIE